MKTEYTLSKHRFYELKHFCLQYPGWKKLYDETDGYSNESGKSKGDTTSRDGIKRATIRGYLDLIEYCARLTDANILPYVIGERWPVPVELRYSYSRFFFELSKRR